jgi:hypothetical protein
VNEETSPNLSAQILSGSERVLDPRSTARDYILHSKVVDRTLEIATLIELLETDLAHHFQLLEHPYVVDRLRQFQQRITIEAAVPPLQQRPPVQFTQLLNVQATPAQAAIAQALYQDYQQWSVAEMSQPDSDVHIGETFRQISESDRPAIATQMWQQWHRNTKLVHDALAPPDLQMAKFIFLSFKDIIQTQLQALQFTKLKVAGLQSSVLHRDDLSKPVSVQIGYDSSRDPPKRRWLWVTGQKFGYLTAESPQLLAGTSAIATIEVLDNPHIIARTEDGLEISIRTHSVISPSCDRVPLEIVDQPSKLKPTWSVKLNDQTVGILSRSTLKLLRAQNQLYAGQKFWVTVERQPPKTAWINLDPNQIVYPAI